MSRIADWIFAWCEEHWTGLIVAFLLIVVGLIALAIRSDMRIQERFMTECVEDGRKRYECEVMWRQANPPAPHVNVQVETR